MRKLLYAKTKLFSKVRVPLVGLSLSASGDRPVGGGLRGIGLSWRTSAEGCVGRGWVVEEEKLFC